MNWRIFTSCFIFLIAGLFVVQAQDSVPRQWNEALLNAIRKDFGKPTIHARNLFHVSVAMYDAWAAYDTVAEPFLLGKTIGDFNCELEPFPMPADIHAAREKAISYAAYRVIRHRFQSSPGAILTLANLDNLMFSLGYDPSFISNDYLSGDPAALGNYIAECVINFGMQDGSNEQNNYANIYYQPVNPPLIMALPGNPDLIDPNRWQPLTLQVFIDQNGNVIPLNTPPFLSPEWGNVVPYSLKQEDLTIYQRDGHDYWVYHDPGAPPYIDTTTVGGESEEYKWNFSLVAAWSGHLDPTDTVMWDISPASIGNIQNYPASLAEYHDFYDFENGGTPSPGHAINPKTGMPYEPQIVPRGDYARVLAEFWADGPNSETPPGHWFTILNYVSSHPDFVKRFNGQGPVLDDDEWYVKAYLALGGAMHDVAVSVWGIKGWYDYIRPVSAIRSMADRGQSSDPGLPSYHPGGIPLVQGKIELVEAGDTLAGLNNENVGKIKLYAWRGPDYVSNPATDDAGAGWILAENWWPYQRPTFVTPPFAGYVSGHSTFSRAAAFTMTKLTGDPFFPGGMGVFSCPENEYLVFEEGPSQDLTLQWATYVDASDQCSLSRIWGGIHPPADDIPGRYIGQEIGEEAFDASVEYFYNDVDEDGFFSFEDCNDNDASINPGTAELCDGIDNNCNGTVDENLTINTYYVDADNDSFGDATLSIDTCAAVAPAGYVSNAMDCNDNDAAIHPNAAEVCDGIDNDCNNSVDDGLTINTYFADTDNDSFGDATLSIDTCAAIAPAGYVTNAMDCNDNDASINPGAAELCDGIDNDCNNSVDDGLTINTFFADADNDSFGDADLFIDTCAAVAPAGYVSNGMDCDDNDASVNPNAVEICDGVDNDCNNSVDDGLIVNTYFVDSDNDTYGDGITFIETCDTLPVGYVLNDLDCDDSNPAVNPDAVEVMDGVDNDCNGLVDDLSAVSDFSERPRKIFPNPATDVLNIRYEYSGQLTAHVFRADGTLTQSVVLNFSNDFAAMDFDTVPPGVYILVCSDMAGRRHFVERVVKI